jgi:CheY-like chemotaxis protein
MKSKVKILIADDDSRNVRIIEEILEGRYVTDLACDGLQTIEKIQSFKPDLVLLDNMMPKLDGLEVCRRIRSELHDHQIKIIIISGRASKQEQLEGLNAGANRYITKPFGDDELISTIHECMAPHPPTSRAY